MNASFRRLLWPALALLAGAATARAEDRKPATAPDPAPAAPATTTPAPDVAAPANPTAKAPDKASDKISEKTSAKKKADDPKKAALPPPPLPLSPRFLQVRDRVKQLYGNREEPRPPIDSRNNPFRSQPVVGTPTPAPASSAPQLASTTTPATGAPVVEPPPPPAANPNLALLKQATALLKVTGAVERDGRTLLNINQALYKEGEVVKVTIKGQSVLLRIKKLSRTSLTLTLGDAETILNF